MSARTARPEAPARARRRPLDSTIVALLVTLSLGACAALAPSTVYPPAASDAISPSTTPATAPGAIPPDAVAMTVTYVHDGDTLYLDDGTGVETKVRLIGVDTPELRPELECFADEATDRLRELAAEGSVVWALPDVDPVDRYGRALFYLWTDGGNFVNLTLVAEGYAEAIRVGDNDAWWPQLRAAEETARAANAGRWGACGS